MAVTSDDLAIALLPVVEPFGVQIHDVEMSNGLIRVTVNRAGGVSLGDLTSANHAVSNYFDEHDPMHGRYTLEVTSPGVERKLRSPAHFVAAVGELVKIKTTPDAVETRRVDGVLLDAGTDSITIQKDPGDNVTLRYDQIERARTVYVWGPEPKPSPSRGGVSKGKPRARTSTPERITT